jgi:[CysO sulfur-carrier protein]-S-L-cysteine hydrolase
LRIPRALLDELIARADASPKAEICGLIAGRDGVATRLLPVVNAAPEPERAYAMDPNDQHRAFTDIEEAGEELLAIYHSHPPEGAYFSGTDLARAYMGDMLAWPDVEYLVVGLKDTRRGPRGVKAFTVADHEATEVPLDVV